MEIQPTDAHLSCACLESLPDLMFAVWSDTARMGHITDLAVESYAKPQHRFPGIVLLWCIVRPALQGRPMLIRKLLWRLAITVVFVATIAGGVYWKFGMGAVAAQPRLIGTVTGSAVTVKGMQRSYVLYIPRNLPPGAPLLFMFHGSGGDGASTREVTGYRFDMLADQYKFVVAYPDGFETTWNDCRKASPQPARVMNIDDESFIEAMIARIAADYRINRKRVFAAGHSNGGQLTFRLAMERPQEFAGIAAISASIPTPDNLACSPGNTAMPAMVINVTADPINPFGGGMVTLGPFTK